MPLNPQQRINRFEKNFSAYRLTFVVILSCILMYQDQEGTYTVKLRSYLSASLYPLQYLVNAPKNLQKNLSENLLGREEIINENQKLKEENLNLKSQMQQVYKLESENKRLYELMDSKPKTNDEYIFADIISTSNILDKHQILINRGSKDGIKLGSSIVDSNGIIGHVIRDQIFASEVLLISDLEHAIPIEIVRTGLRSIAVGTGNHARLKINMLPVNSDIQKEDILITSGLGGRYPEGFPVGTVKNIKSNSGESFLEVEILPFANLKTINEVWIIITNE
jgi:rod shape-determining protein MreC|tara:strand:- start:13456 stop:14295 length:840 start_codon:yes stop_codon:yes gene_type:complete